MNDKEEKVLEAMKNAGQPVRPGDVVTSTGLSKEEVSKTITSLKKQGLIISPKRCYYSPAE